MISVGIIGCGDVAEYGHLPTLVEHERFEPIAVCDIESARAKLLAMRAGGIPTYGDWRKMIANERLDAVVLALPPEISSNVAETCLAQGLAVLDEKPLAASLATGRRLARVVLDQDCVYQVGFVLRYGDWVGDIRRLSSNLGAPLQVSVDIFDERLDVRNGVHLSRIQSFLRNSSALTHEGSHVVDYVGLWLNSNWSSVTASAHKTLDIFDGPNIWRAHVDFEDRASLDLQVGWLLTELPPSTVAVAGPCGRLDFNFASGRGELKMNGGREPLDWTPVTAEWRRQYDAFAEAIDRGHANAATVQDALCALEVTAACELSALEDRSVTREELQSIATVKRIHSRHHWPAPPKISSTHVTNDPLAGRQSAAKVESK